MRLPALLVTLCLILSAHAQERISLVQVVDLSGANADTGRDFVTGARTYFDALNAKGGINGRQLELIVADDGGNPARTETLTGQLIKTHQPVALFGYLGADNVRAALRTAARSNPSLPMVAPYAGINIDETGQAPVYYLRASSDEEVRKIIRVAQGSGVKRVALLSSEDSLGRAASQQVAQGLKEAGVSLVGHAVLAANSVDVDGAVRSLLKAEPQAIILAAPTISSAAFVQAYQKERSGTQFMALSWVNPQTMLEFLGPDQVRWVAVSALVPSPYNPVKSIAREFVQQLKKYRDEAPSYASMEGYLAAKMLADGLRRAGTINREALQLALANTNVDIGGVRLQLSPRARRASRYVELAVFSGAGRLVN